MSSLPSVNRSRCRVQFGPGGELVYFVGTMRPAWDEELRAGLLVHLRGDEAQLAERCQR